MSINEQIKAIDDAERLDALERQVESLVGATSSLAATVVSLTKQVARIADVLHELLIAAGRDDLPAHERRLRSALDATDDEGKPT